MRDPIKVFVWWTYASILWLTPLLFFPLIQFVPFPFALFQIDVRTSELFELPKMFWLYAMTALLVCGCGIGIARTTLFYRVPKSLAWVLILLGCGAVLSTVISIDRFTSIFGYPSRLHGGLLSLLCYLTLIAGYLMLDFSKALLRVHIGGVFVVGVGISAYACLQLLGLDVALWDQNAQARVFATLGQPNWLAAYLGAVCLWGGWLYTQSTYLYTRIVIGFGCVLMFVAIIATGSRAGLVGCFVAGSFVLGCLAYHAMRTQQFQKKWLLLGLLPLTLGIFYRVNEGATETARIRMAVWEGAWDAFLAHPLFGTGLETFAYTFYAHRPTALLHTTEWAFLYNKAHNELLQVLVTQGLFGVTLYVISAAVIFMTFIRSLSPITSYMQTAQRACVMASLLLLGVTNVFGFSTVTVALMTILAIVVLFHQYSATPIHFHRPRLVGSIVVSFGVICGIGTGFMIVTDLTYAQSKLALERGNLSESLSALERAVSLGFWHPFYQNEWGYLQSYLARRLHDERSSPDLVEMYQFRGDEAIKYSLSLSPANVLLWRKAAASYYELQQIDARHQKAMLLASDRVRQLAPTDLKLQMGLVEYYRTADEHDSADSLEKHLLELKN